MRSQKKKDLIDLLYPVGAIYTCVAKPPWMDEYGEWKEVGAGRVLWGADGNHDAGTEIEAGLPNINGKIGPIHTSYKTASGAFSIGRVIVSGAQSGTGGNWYENALYAANFDASLSNAIYGSSDTVQPPAYVVHFYQRVS